MYSVAFEVWVLFGLLCVAQKKKKKAVIQKKTEKEKALKVELHMKNERVGKQKNKYH